MKLEKHCESCLEKLGDEFREVNIWLDMGAEELIPKIRNRAKKHHQEGLIECMDYFSKLYDAKYGIKAVEAAKIHIYDDCGCIPSKSDYDEEGFLHHTMYEKKLAQESTKFMI
jgi:hypothetical protein